MKLIKNIFLTFFLLINLSINAFSVEGLATTYKVTIQQIALCEAAASTLSSCSNPVVVYEADSGEIDIANTSEGAAAATLGSATSAVIGTSYSHVQVVMNRLITIAGSGISDGSATCGTKGGSAGTSSANAVGAANGTNGDKVVAAGVQGSPLGNAGTPLTAITSDSTAGAGANGNVGNHTFFSWRVALSTTFIYDGIVNPSVSVAFGTNTAMGFTSGGGTACIAYAAAPDVTITIN